MPRVIDRDYSNSNFAGIGRHSNHHWVTLPALATAQWTIATDALVESLAPRRITARSILLYHRHVERPLKQYVVTAKLGMSSATHLLIWRVLKQQKPQFLPFCTCILSNVYTIIKSFGIYLLSTSLQSVWVEVQYSVEFLCNLWPMRAVMPLLNIWTCLLWFKAGTTALS